MWTTSGADLWDIVFTMARITGVEKVYTDKMSGKDAERPELQKMINYVREGDTVTVESVSRFARNTKDLLELTAALESKGVQFVSQKENIDTTSSTGKFMLTVFGAIAELERAYILERQAEGIAIAKAEGRMTGRPRKTVDNFDNLYTDVREGRLSATKAAKQLNISRSTWYRRARDFEDENRIIDI